MNLPPSMAPSHPNKVCKLQKSLYGLKQASRQWYAKLITTLLALQFIQLSADHSLFIKNTEVYFTTLLIYVDDIVLAGNDPNEIDYVKTHLDNEFNIKNLGHLRYFLGLEISRSSFGIVVNQRKYALEILEENGMFAAKPVTTPMEPSTKLNSSSGNPLSDP